jgi:predicted RNA-binding protein with PUA-like domain
MAYWLLKSEPEKYSWLQLEADKQTFWDGVRNYAARNHIKAMKKGELCFYYHSNEGLEIVGVAKVIKEYYQDPTTADPNWVVVDISPVKKFKKPVKLSDIKEEKVLANMVLIKNSRLSVQPVTIKEFEFICKMADTKI